MYALLATGEFHQYLVDPATPWPIKLILGVLLLATVLFLGHVTTGWGEQADAEEAKRQQSLTTDETNVQEKEGSSQAATTQAGPCDHQIRPFDGAQGTTVYSGYHGYQGSGT